MIEPIKYEGKTEGKATYIDILKLIHKINELIDYLKEKEDAEKVERCPDEKGLFCGHYHRRFLGRKGSYAEMKCDDCGEIFKTDSLPPENTISDMTELEACRDANVQKKKKIMELEAFIEQYFSKNEGIRYSRIIELEQENVRLRHGTGKPSAMGEDV